MKILVFSDSHAGLSFMRRCVRAVRPDTIIHLGDYFDDAEVIAQENPHLVVHRVPGNCDLYHGYYHEPQVLCYDVFGVRLYMTHGHKHSVKSGLYALLRDARKNQAKAALYGHTHIADCHLEDDMWVLNPGSCGSYHGSCGVMEIENGKIAACYILRQADLEEML